MEKGNLHSHIDNIRCDDYNGRIGYFGFEVTGLETMYEQNAKVFKAFCDEKRLRILEMLRSGEKCTCKLMEVMDMPQSTLSYHMKVLCEAGVVQGRQDGKWTHYHLCEPGSLAAVALLQQLLAPAADIPTQDACCAR